ncbi:MAG: pitrilysin family protein [Chloroflexi bacterium]|nr:pitrilysin family protein [Chloroflexota bacterium]
MTRGPALGPETVARSTLANGMVLLVYPNPSSPSVAVAAQHAAGAILETEDDCGLAGLTADGLNRGTATRSFMEFSAELDDVGASLNFGAGIEHGSFSGRALAEDLDVLLRLAADGLQNSTFPDEEVERLRDQALTGIAHVENNPGALADRRFRELLFGRDNPYGRPDEGYADTMRALTPTAVRDFHAEAFDPASIVLAVVGAVTPDAVRDLTARYFEDWRGPGTGAAERQRDAIRTFDTAATTAGGVREDLSLAGKTQTEFTLGWPGVRRLDSAYFPVMMGNYILGQLGLGGRIGANVRDAQGLAYHATSHAEAAHARMPWTIRAGVNPVNVPKAVSSGLAEARCLMDEPPTEEELRLTKQAMIGSLPLRLERNGGIAGMLLTIENFGLGLDYLMRYPDIVEAVTADDVQQAAARLLDPEAYTLVTAGPELPA